MKREREAPLVPTCSQCTKQAIGSVSGVNLCLECYERWESIRIQHVRHLMSFVNQLQDEMDDVWASYGVRSRGPRYELPPLAPIVKHLGGPVTFHNISVQGSVIGAINTGNVRTIDVAIGNLNKSDPTLADALKQLTEAVVQSTELQAKGKEEVLEQLSFLSAQAVVPKGTRQPGMIKAVLDGVSKAVSTTNALLTLWHKVHPILSHALGL